MTTPGRYTGRIAVVTGGGGGIGAATVRQLVEEGARHVHIVDVDAAAAVELADELDASGARCTAHGVDVSDPAGWWQIRRALDSEQRLDLLVHNAYTAVVRPLLQQTPDQWDRQLGVNLSSHFHAAQALLPLLLKTGGSIVNVSSVHASVGVPGYPAYAAAKGAVQALSRQLAMEYGPTLRVNTVSPGPVQTGAWQDSSEREIAAAAAATALGRIGRPEEVAEAICFLGSDDASFITGSDLTVDGGWLVQKDSP